MLHRLSLAHPSQANNKCHLMVASSLVQITDTTGLGLLTDRRQVVIQGHMVVPTTFHPDIQATRVGNSIPAVGIIPLLPLLNNSSSSQEWLPQVEKGLLLNLVPRELLDRKGIPELNLLVLDSSNHDRSTNR